VYFLNNRFLTVGNIDNSTDSDCLLIRKNRLTPIPIPIIGQSLRKAISSSQEKVVAINRNCKEQQGLTARGKQQQQQQGASVAKWLAHLPFTSKVAGSNLSENLVFMRKE
jgi:hypothetical protein